MKGQESVQSPRFYGAREERTDEKHLQQLQGQRRWWDWRSCVLPAGVMMEKAEELMPRGVPYVRNKADAAAKGTREAPVARPHCREYHAGS